MAEGLGPRVLRLRVTGLLFDKVDGRCLKSSNVNLDLDSLKPALPWEFNAYMAARQQVGERKSMTIGKGGDSE